jgi:hypothetical protein
MSKSRGCGSKIFCPAVARETGLNCIYVTSNKVFGWDSIGVPLNASEYCQEYLNSVGDLYTPTTVRHNRRSCVSRRRN